MRTEALEKCLAGDGGPTETVEVTDYCTLCGYSSPREGSWESEELTPSQAGVRASAVAHRQAFISRTGRQVEMGGS